MRDRVARVGARTRMRPAVPLLGILMAGLMALGAAVAPKKRAPANGRVSYSFDGALKGTVRITWADNGKKYRMEIKPGGACSAKTTRDVWQVCDGQSLYIHTPEAGKRVVRVPAAESFQRCLWGPEDTAAAKALGKGVLLGRECRIYVNGTEQSWVWQDIPLKVRTQSCAGSTDIVATELDVTSALPATLFRVPAGYQVVDPEPPSGMMPQPHPKWEGAPRA